MPSGVQPRRGLTPQPPNTFDFEPVAAGSCSFRAFVGTAGEPTNELGLEELPLPQARALPLRYQEKRVSHFTTVRMTVQGNCAQNLTVRVRTQPAVQPLRFGTGNAKLAPGIFTFSLPAGHSCPAAKECQSRANRRTGTITDGRHTEFRCYAATMEARHSSVRRARWHNLEQLKACGSADAMARLILDSLSPFCRVLRVHDSGDFFSTDYFSAWVAVARHRPDTRVYWYTKSLRSWLAHRAEVGDGYTPGTVPNVVPTASWGGRYDHLITEHKLRSAKVVYSVTEAESMDLDIDHDDGHAMNHGPDFALLLHGTQPAGSEAAVAYRALRDGGFTGYGRSRIPLN